MTALITIAVLSALLLLLLGRLALATPLGQTLSITIDHWADGVQGDMERLS